VAVAGEYRPRISPVITARNRVTSVVEHVTDRVSNPFDITAPTDAPFSADRAPVFGYGDVNADFHVVGDHPGVHGGRETGVPFTVGLAGRRLQRVLHAVGLLADPYSDRPDPQNVFFSYLHLLTPPAERDPTEEEYGSLEPFFDAEFRAINAHVLLPVGRRAIDYVLSNHTASAYRVDTDPRALHATQRKGRGYLVVPVLEPAAWAESDEDALRETLADVLSRDYRQTSDLGRFLSEAERYEVR
jgi:uracil-DNA glycosylase family 4